MTCEYYLVKQVCDHCGSTVSEPLGHSAVGWCFLFYTNERRKTLEDFMRDIKDPKCRIENEYREIEEKPHFLNFIEGKKGGRTHSALCDKTLHVDGFDFQERGDAHD